MTRRTLVFAALAGGLFAGTGCPPPPETKITNAPPGREVEDQPAVARYYASHNDRGLLASKAIVDAHFESDSDRLSGAGEVCLERFAELLADSGGTIRYDTAIADPNLVALRIATAKEYLAAISLNPGAPIDVVQGPSGGRGMSARESIAGQGVAKQPEPRGNAYSLQGAGGSAAGGGGN